MTTKTDKPAKTQTDTTATKAQDKANASQRRRVLESLEKLEGEKGKRMAEALRLTADTGSRFTKEELTKFWPSCEHAGVYASTFNAGASAAARIGREAALALIDAQKGFKAMHKACTAAAAEAKAIAGAGTKPVTDEQKAAVIAAATKAATAAPVSRRVVNAPAAGKTPDAATDAPKAPPVVDEAQALLAALVVLADRMADFAKTAPEGVRGAAKDAALHVSRAREAFSPCVKAGKASAK